MIEIKNADNASAAAVCSERGLPFCDVFEMRDRDRCFGVACVQQEGEKLSFLHIEAPDTALTDALLRAALNAMKAKGVCFVRIVCESLKEHMLEKGYFTDSSQCELKIKDFFAKSACKG